jgi:hypothetical protein
MLILKSQSFLTHHSITVFVNKNNILRENILTITNGPGVGSSEEYTIFFMAILM